jgi:hypothetical protein
MKFPSLFALTLGGEDTGGPLDKLVTVTIRFLRRLYLMHNFLDSLWCRREESNLTAHRDLLYRKASAQHSAVGNLSTSPQPISYIFLFLGFFDLLFAFFDEPQPTACSQPLNN